MYMIIKVNSNNLIEHLIMYSSNYVRRSNIISDIEIK